MAAERTYIAIDLKSFYASVECVERGLDPLTTNLVVADPSRTDKTICLAVSPSLKACGIPGRPRLFEVNRQVRRINESRRRAIGGRPFTGSSVFSAELQARPDLSLDFITATPRMSFYIEYSARVYDTYLKYIAPEDIHVYSIDEVFIDATPYLFTYGKTARDLAMTIIRDVLSRTGITATAGIGTNLYLAKIAMDIVAKKMRPDKDGVRIAELDEMSYRSQLWNHRPLKDFWRVGSGIASRLERYGIRTMGDLARLSLKNEDLLYELFGVNAELLIDHAWGWEPCTMEQIKAYRPTTNSLSSGQVLQEPYTAAKARIVVQEMAENAALDLIDKKLVTDQIVLTVGYDTSSLSDPTVSYKGPVVTDRYGRPVPKHGHGTLNLPRSTSSAHILTQAAVTLFDRITDPTLKIRRLTLVTNRVTDEASVCLSPVQLDLFAPEGEGERDAALLEKERKLQDTVLKIKKQFGKNAILKGLNYEDGATARSRNTQIGGHKE